MKRTPWFPCSTPPVRHGVYETRIIKRAAPVLLRYDGKHWRHVKNGNACNFFGPPWDGDQWRGLAENPE